MSIFVKIYIVIGILFLYMVARIVTPEKHRWKI